MSANHKGLLGMSSRRIIVCVIILVFVLLAPTILSYEVTPLFNDNFANDNPYIITDGQTSPNGLWYCSYAGYGSTGVTSAQGTNVFFLQPETPTSPTGADSHAALVISTQQFSNFTADLTVNTVQQLRENYPPNSWEVAWIFFRYSNSPQTANSAAGSYNYYLLFDSSDVELGKIVDGVQNILFSENLPISGFQFTLNTWYTVQITCVGNNIQVWINGTRYVDYTDNTMQSQLAKGSICMYCEDSLAEFGSVQVNSATTTLTPSPTATPSPSPTPSPTHFHRH